MPRKAAFSAALSAASAVKAFVGRHPERAASLPMPGLGGEIRTSEETLADTAGRYLLASRNALSRDFCRIVGLIEQGTSDTRPWIQRYAPCAGTIAVYTRGERSGVPLLMKKAARRPTTCTTATRNRQRTTHMTKDRHSGPSGRYDGLPSRRAVLAAGAAFATTAAAGRFGRAAAADDLLVGHASVDTTPPNGIELAGFHRAPGNPRLITGSRQPAAARVIVVEKGPVKAAIVVLDIIAVSAAFARRFARAVEDRLGIPADHVRVCATHTHSMPTLLPLRQWGAVPEAYGAAVVERGVEAVERAWRDRSAARLLVGSSRVAGGNFNRTVKPGHARTDADFGPASDDSERWLDTMLHALVFERAAGKPPIIAYHFSAHPVCFNDTLSGPDWAGVVAEKCRAVRGVDPVFLQGHSGDVNPGDGTKWIGDVESTAHAISKGLDAALEAARETAVDRLESIRQPLDLPLDLDRYRDWLAAYRADPAACLKGPWVDAGFAADWFQAAAAVENPPRVRPTTLSSLRLGPVAMLFHPAELYGCYGLAIRRDSGAPTTLCVGYTDDFVGYVTDPAAYARGEYAALTVPKLLDLPPFTTDAGRHLAAAATALLAKRW